MIITVVCYCLLRRFIATEMEHIRLLQPPTRELFHPPGPFKIDEVNNRH